MVDFRRYEKVKVITRVTPSEELVAANSIKGKDGKDFSLADKRVDEILERVNAFISNNKLEVPKDQKLIASEVVRLIHSDEFYGKYNEKIKGEDSSGKKLQARIESLEGKKELSKAESKELASLIKNREEDKKKDNEYYFARGSSLAEMKKDSLVCREQAAITSIVLHKVNIPNDLCRDNDYIGRTNHAFVQLVHGGDIVEATDPKNPYRENISGGYVRGGSVVITREPVTLGTHSYGRGSISKEDEQVLKEKGHSEKVYRELYNKDYDRAMVNYELVTVVKDRRNGELDMSKPVSVSDALANAEANFFQHDKPKRLLGFVTERRDGTLSLEEVTKMQEHQKGRKLSDKEIENLKKFHQPEIKVYDKFDVKVARSVISGIDADHNGEITPQEFAKAVKDLPVEHNRIFNRPITALELERGIAKLQETVYGGASSREATVKYEEKILDARKHSKPHDENRPITVKDAIENAEAHAFSVDKQKKLFGFIPIGKRDGYLSVEERIDDFEKDIGRKLTDKERKDYYKEPLDIVGNSRIASEWARAADKNHDGLITPKEFTDQIGKDAKRLFGPALTPQQLEKFTNSRAKEIYGRE